MSTLTKAFQPQTRHFSFDREQESFLIANPADGSEIVIPRLEKIFQSALDIYPGNYMTLLNDGTKLSVASPYGGGYFGPREYLMSNRESGWMIFGNKSESQMAFNEDESVRGSKAIHLISPDQYNFTLIDFKSSARYYFSGVILDHRGLQRREIIENTDVQASPLEGMWYGGMWMELAGIRKIEDKFLSVFERDHPRCAELASRGIFYKEWTNYDTGSGDIEEAIVVLKGEPKKGEPLLRIEKYLGHRNTNETGYKQYDRFKLDRDCVYGDPTSRFEFYDRAGVDKPVFERGHVALYKTMGGIVIEDSFKQENFYILDEAKIYLHTSNHFPSRSLADFSSDDIEIADIGGSKYKWAVRFDRDADRSEGPLRRHLKQPLIDLMNDLDNPQSLRALLEKAYYGKMPATGHLGWHRKRRAEQLPERLADISELSPFIPGGP